MHNKVFIFKSNYCFYLCLSIVRSALSLCEVEEKCKQAAALKLPLSRLELNAGEIQELFQVSSRTSLTRNML